VELLGLAAFGIGMIVVVFVVGVGIQILFNRRFGVQSRGRWDQGANRYQHSGRNLGGFGPRGGKQ
jgi:hypothetical protein